MAGYIAVAALRGEIGASRVETRIIETILLFAKDSFTGPFEKIKDYMSHEKETEKGIWIRTANSYRQEIGVSWEEIMDMDRRKLKLKIRDWDTQQWLEEVVQRPTLQWYREAKLYIGYDDCYRNNSNSDYLAKARTNCLQLEEYFDRRNRNHDTTCKLCNQGEKKLEHFLVVCPRLQAKETLQ